MTFNEVTRRTFLSRTAMGLGTVALRSLLDPQLFAKPANGVVNPSHSAPKPKLVICLTMPGGPSHLEPFDPKPVLGKMHGTPMPESLTKGQQIAQLQGQKLVCYGPQTKFAKFGRCGMEVCDLFPQ